MEATVDIQYPSVGCHVCDSLRKHRENPDVRCLRHDPTISAEERKRLAVKFETLVVGTHGKPDTVKEKPMNGKDKPNNRGVTPKAIAMWPFIHKAAKKYENKGEEYKITLLFDPANPEQKAFLGYLRQLMGECGKEFGITCKHSPFRKHLDPETKAETPLWEVTFRSDVKYPPRVFDAQGTLVVGDTKMGNGSIVKVAYSYKFYKEQGGVVKLYLSAVQIIDLVEYLGANAESYGFGTEDGYSATQKFGDEFPPADTVGEMPPIPDSDIPF